MKTWIKLSVLATSAAILAGCNSTSDNGNETTLLALSGFHVPASLANNSTTTINTPLTTTVSAIHGFTLTPKKVGATQFTISALRFDPDTQNTAPASAVVFNSGAGACSLKGTIPCTLSISFGNGMNSGDKISGHIHIAVNGGSVTVAPLNQPITTQFVAASALPYGLAFANAPHLAPDNVAEFTVRNTTSGSIYGVKLDMSQLVGASISSGGQVLSHILPGTVTVNGNPATITSGVITAPNPLTANGTANDSATFAFELDSGAGSALGSGYSALRANQTTKLISFTANNARTAHPPLLVSTQPMDWALTQNPFDIKKVGEQDMKLMLENGAANGFTITGINHGTLPTGVSVLTSGTTCTNTHTVAAGTDCVFNLSATSGAHGTGTISVTYKNEHDTTGTPKTFTTQGQINVDKVTASLSGLTQNEVITKPSDNSIETRLITLTNNGPFDLKALTTGTLAQYFDVTNNGSTTSGVSIVSSGATPCGNFTKDGSALDVGASCTMALNVTSGAPEVGSAAINFNAQGTNNLSTTVTSGFSITSGADGEIQVENANQQIITSGELVAKSDSLTLTLKNVGSGAVTFKNGTPSFALTGSSGGLTSGGIILTTSGCKQALATDQSCTATLTTSGANVISGSGTGHIQLTYNNSNNNEQFPISIVPVDVLVLFVSTAAGNGDLGSWDNNYGNPNYSSGSIQSAFNTSGAAAGDKICQLEAHDRNYSAPNGFRAILGVQFQATWNARLDDTPAAWTVDSKVINSSGGVLKPVGGPVSEDMGLYGNPAPYSELVWTGGHHDIRFISSCLDWKRAIGDDAVGNFGAANLTNLLGSPAVWYISSDSCSVHHPLYCTGPAAKN